jgi:hypothetical protein
MSRVPLLALLVLLALSVVLAKVNAQSVLVESIALVMVYPVCLVLLENHHP